MEKSEPLYTVSGNVKWLGKTVWTFLKKSKLEVPTQSSNPTSEYISRRIRITISRVIYMLKFQVHCSIILNSQAAGETAKVPIDKWINKKKCTMDMTQP